MQTGDKLGFAVTEQDKKTHLLVSVLEVRPKTDPLVLRIEAYFSRMEKIHLSTKNGHQMSLSEMQSVLAEGDAAIEEFEELAALARKVVQ